MARGKPITQSMLRSLTESRGNSRACILTEPLWGVPFHLFSPFASVYMLALGVSASGIGTIAAFTLACQVVFSLLGGPITDKLGRKRATLIFDILSWSVPTLIWAVAQNPVWFYTAAFFNAIVRVPMTSWTCLLIEDAPRDRIVHYWAWVHIGGIIAGVVTPIAALLVDRFSLVPTMRAIYAFGFISMTAKFIILNVAATETRQGEIRMRATADIPFTILMRESIGMIRSVFTMRGTLAVMILLSLNAIYISVRNAFFGVLLTESMGFAPHHLGWLASVKSGVMLVFFFFILPRLKTNRNERYLAAGIVAIAISFIGLLITPYGNVSFVIAVVFVESCGAALLVPHLQGFVYDAIDPEERARTLAVANTIVLAIASPFGWIAGQLSEIAHELPFVLLLIVFISVGAYLMIHQRESARTTDEHPDR